MQAVKLPALLSVFAASLAACQTSPATTTTETEPMRPIVIVLASAMAVSGCQIRNVPDLPADQCLLPEDEVSVYTPILLSRSDDLTPDTLAQVVAHNNVYWCRHEDERPEGFDASVCEG